MNTSNFPNSDEIAKWNDNHLVRVLNAIENIGYNVPVYGNETSEDRDSYIMTVISEKQKRNL